MSRAAINKTRHGVDHSKLGNGQGFAAQPYIGYSHRHRDEKYVSDFSINVIHDAMLSTGVARVRITSTYRSPADQVRVMLENFTPGKSMYRAMGKKVEAVAANMKYTRADAGTSKQQTVVYAITNEVAQLEHEHGVGCVSHHQKDPDAVNVIDIAAASVIPKNKREEFVRQLTNSVFVARVGIPKDMKPYSPKHFHETAHCIHLEIPQPKFN